MRYRMMVTFIVLEAVTVQRITKRAASPMALKRCLLEDTDFVTVTIVNLL